MYKIFNITIFLALLLLCSCVRINDKEKDIVKTIEDSKDKENEVLADSIRIDVVLQEALKIAAQNIDQNTFFKEYKISSEYGVDAKVQINSDYHFTELHPHLIIHRYIYGDVYIDIYSEKDKKIEKVLSIKEWDITYINDTVQDINGDNFNDFVINGYGSSGCCLKAYSNVYLFRPNSSSFSDCFDFLNPTFSPKEKIVRGICYGHPGETEMYKYEWDGEKIDTLEYVSFERDSQNQKTGMVIISDACPYSDDYKVLKRLKKVPAEYHTIMGYDWFTGEGYE